MLPGILSPQITQMPPINVQFLATLKSTDVSTATFTGVPFGEASSDRNIFVSVTKNPSRTTSSFTIGGVTATPIYVPEESGVIPQFWYAPVPTGTSGTISITENNTASRILGVYRVSNWNGVLFSSAINGSGAQINPSLNISIPQRGAAIAACRNADNTTPYGAWSGAVEDWQDSIIGGGGSNGLRSTGASVGVTPADAAHVISVVSSVGARLSAISLAPA